MEYDLLDGWPYDVFTLPWRAGLSPCSEGLPPEPPCHEGRFRHAIEPDMPSENQRSRPMTIQKIDKSEWRPYFDGLSQLLAGAQAEIEVAALPLGDQIAAEWVPFFGIVYDHKDDLIEIALENYDHLIPRPREVWFDADAGGLASLQIVDAEGVRQIVKLRDPLMLPAPAH
jgi:hypothetical protein